MTFAQSRAQLQRFTQQAVLPGLERTRQMLAYLQQPDQHYPKVQITGTNGKGSVAAALAAILMQSGLRVGRFTSPHLADERERISINGKNIPVQAFVRGVQRLLPVLRRLKQAGNSATEFEAWTVLAADYFYRARVDVAVIEVGMGGRWDATTALDRRILAILTQIELDHTKILGKTKTAILKEKLGIARSGAPLLSAELDPVLRAKMRVHAAGLKYPLFFSGIGPQDEIWVEQWDRRPQGLRLTVAGKNQCSRTMTTALRGRIQIHNLPLAILAAQTLRTMGMPVTWEAIHRGLSQVEWPGRMEKVWSQPLVFLDGAHNPAGIRALVREMQEAYPHNRWHMVFGMMRDKDIRTVVRLLHGQPKSIFTVTAPDARGIPAEELAHILRSCASEVIPMPDFSHALSAARQRAGKQDIIVVAGSLYNIAPARQAIKRWKKP